MMSRESRRTQKEWAHLQVKQPYLDCVTQTLACLIFGKVLGRRVDMASQEMVDQLARTQIRVNSGV